MKAGVIKSKCSSRGEGVSESKGWSYFLFIWVPLHLEVCLDSSLAEKSFVCALLAPWILIGGEGLSESGVAWKHMSGTEVALPGI